MDTKFILTNSKFKKKKMDCIFLYTDGGINGGNPGNAGAGVYIIYPEYQQEISEFVGFGTNNFAELKAIEIGLIKLLNQGYIDFPIRLYSDSKYSLGVLINKNWNPTKNLELIKDIRGVIQNFSRLTMYHVKGHAGNYGNEKADKLATFGKNKVIINRKIKNKKFI